MISVEAAIEADQIGLDFHLTDPLGNWSVYEVLTDGLLAARADYRDALACHDHGRADRAMLEITDLTALCAAAAEALALQRARFFRSDRPWPLTPVPVP